jgi:SNF2 family DNA or RNA helicase
VQIIQDKALLLDRQYAGNIIPHIKKSQKVDEGVAVHWGLDEAMKLVDLGFPNVPSPILRDYNWPGRFIPFEHQKDTSSFLSLRRRAFCFSEQGTSKTAAAIWAADYLLNHGYVSRVLVLCPLSIMRSVWQQELFRVAMHRSCAIAHGTSKQRVKALNYGTDFVVINYDGVGIVEKEIIAGGFDLIICDEANYLKTASTSRWKVVNRIMQATDPRLWMMTGTPAAQSPVDAYGLAKLVNPFRCPKYFGEFRATVMNKVTEFKWAPKPTAAAYVHKLLQPAIRYEKKDCLDLPPVTYIDRDAPLTSQQKIYYEELRQQMLIELGGGVDISAVNAAVKINKLLQISAGAAYTDTKGVVEFDSSTRIKAVKEVIEEASNKVLIFVPFTHTIDILSEQLGKAGISHGVINGSTSLNQRTKLINDFQTKPDPHVMVIQPAAAAHGVTLTAADTIVWYAPITSVDTYLQANARIDRPGQKNAMTVVHITGSPVEARLYAMLRSNIHNHEELIDLYRDIVQGGS